MSSRARSMGLSKAPVDNALSRITAALADIDAELDLLDRRVDALEAGWSGEAREAFSVAMRECRAALADLHHIGSGLTRVAQHSVTRFDDFDRRRASAWSR